ncbi:hypothetical protein FGM00_05520 [Aggregatimonas sangjinii]|uniref:Uncharacterized protein n=1 Tax=Aggregatimonas sangjinii TaxID=2583587 RepID=A0A5B7SM80_9FLAO|nr:hypothetical protein [Aggregatimonas sangjinii]QCW99586.1 hypothetical protein FGM00_05520 [Aggregatimonas sangjinii]
MKTSLYKSTITNFIITTFLVLGIGIGFSQEEQVGGVLSTTTVQTLNFDRNGTKIPYTITTQENRIYSATFKQSKENKENFERMESPALVSKMITINSEIDSTLNKRIILRYKKRLADTFELVPTEKGFQIEVDGNLIDYAVESGVYAIDAASKNFFVIDEFDVVD